MADVIRHRGPDDFGYWHDAEAGIGLAHRRLSILDLSAAGHQPMVSRTGRFWIVFNGEIYNHLEIREDLEKSSISLLDGPHLERVGFCDWRGHSDTETLLAGFEAWGVEATLERSVGMFALALWDKAERTLTLARDRMGEKPVYYGWNRGAFLFASELKSLRSYPGFDAEINRSAIALLLRHNYVPTPYSIYRGIFKLWPGTTLTLHEGANSSCPWDPDFPPFEPFLGKGISLRPFWSLRHVVEEGQANLFTGTEKEALVELERVLVDAIQSQQISDVPLGAFLSGGVDSSTIVALMQSCSTRPVKTFTIGFHEAGYDEAQYAKAVATHLGTDHTELYVTPNEALKVIPNLPMMYDEPFSDSSQIPTSLVSHLARRHVTVALSGDAGDELFGGYSRYFWAQSIKTNMDKLPAYIRHGLADGIRLLSAERWNQLTRPLKPLFRARRRGAFLGDKAHVIADLLAEEHPENVYRRLVSHWKQPFDVVIGASEPLTVLTNQRQWAALPDFIQQLMFLDFMTYLPDDILVKVDRAAMAVSLETRIPLLDHRLIEFAWSLPFSMKVRNGQGKWLLRQVLYKYVPPEMIERPKTGFGVPIDVWLRGPLRDWAEALLDDARLKREGFFNPEPIRRKWREHISGQRNNHYYLWDVLMFQAWLESTR